MSTTTNKHIPKLTEKAKAAVEERQALLNQPPNSIDTNERGTPSEAASTRPSTKCKTTDSGDAVRKKARNMVDVDKDIPTDKECTCNSTDEEHARNSSPAVELVAESTENELGTFEVLQIHITSNLFCRAHVEGVDLTSLSIF